MTPTRPTLRYHGGKWMLAPWIIGHFPDHKIYVEPYGGAASVLIRKPRSYAEVYNEMDDEIVNVFKTLRDPKMANILEGMLRLTPFSRVEFTESYNLADTTLERARRTIVRAYMGFGSVGVSGKKTGFRANSNRSGTTPAHDWTNFADCISSFTDRLRGVVIESRSAVAVMEHQDSARTLHYVDPPYLESTRKSFGVAYRHEMSDAQHLELLEFLKTLDGMVVLSGYGNDMYDSVLDGWNRVQRKALADGARERTEVLWLSPNIKKQSRLFDAG